MNRNEIADAVCGRLEREAADIAKQWKGSFPISHFVIDDILPADVASRIRDAFPVSGDMKIKRSIREVKFISAQMNAHDPILEEAIYAFQDPRIVEAVGRATGLKELEPDSHLYAGGISMMKRGHYLNPHIDNSHDKNRERYRVLNLLYYVSPGWKVANGGNLELWPKGVESNQLTIESRFNRLVVMVTHKASWHSVSPVVTDDLRCCVSNYYFSRLPADNENYFHVTSYRGRPGQYIRDICLKTDARLRMSIRSLFPKGLLENKHFYDRKPEVRATVRILLVSTLYPPDVGGGAEIVLQSHAQGMVSRGHEVRVVVTSGGDERSFDEVEGVEVVHVPLRNLYWHHSSVRRPAALRFLWHLRDADNPAMGRALDAEIVAYAPDVVVFHNLVGWSVAAWKSAFAHEVPTVQVLHDYYHACPKSQLFRDGRNCSGTCAGCAVLRVGRADHSSRLSAVVGVSQAVLDGHLRRGIFRDVPIQRVIRNAWTPQKRRERRSDGGPLTFGFIGTISEWKGIRLLLEAFSRVCADATLPPMQLLVAGTGEDGYVAELHARFASENVKFLGRLTPKAFFEQVDVSVAPSLWNDPLPMVVFESMLFGVPVIGTRRGGIPEMIEHGRNGLLFDPDESGSLEACLRRIAGGPHVIDELSQAAFESSAPFAELDHAIDDYVATCAEVVDRATAREALVR